MTAGPRFDALQMLEDACSKHSVRLDLLVAETSLWAHPEVHHRIVAKNKSTAVYPLVRRVNVSKGEERGQVIDGVRLDDNTYANRAIKEALGVSRQNLIGFECCHIWPKTCYDTRYHTAIANLVLLPRALAGLTDHSPSIQRAIQFRAFELYGWHPAELPPPVRPAGYPENWVAPMADAITTRSTSPPSSGIIRGSTTSITNNGPVSFQKIRDWASKSNTNVHAIIALASRRMPVSRAQLESEVGELGISKNAYGAISSLMTNLGNSYGLVFVLDDRGLLSFHPGLREEISRHRWTIPASPVRT